MWRADSLEKIWEKSETFLRKVWGQEKKGEDRGWQLDSTIDAMDMSLSKLQDIVKDKEAWGAAVHGAAESDMT